MPLLKVGEFSGESQVEGLSIAGAAEAQASGAKLGKIQRTAGAEAIASYAPMGEVQKQQGKVQGEAGIWLKEQGHKLELKNKKAMYDGIFDVINNLATMDLGKKATKETSSNLSSMQSVLDDFSKLNNYGRGSGPRTGWEAGKAIDTINKEIVNKYSSALPNEIYKAKFQQSMGQVSSAYKNQATDAQRQSNYNLARTAVDDSVNNQIKLGLMDKPENLALYSSRGLDSINRGLSNGSLDAQEGARLGDKLRKGLYRGSIQVGNTTSPGTIRQLLESKSPEDLNLNPQEYKGLAFQNAAALKDEERDAIAQYKQQEEITKQQQTLLNFQLSEGIKDNTTKSSTIIDEYNKGNLDFKQFTGLLSKYHDTALKQNTVLDQRNNISKAILNGDTLQSYSPNQINDHYKNLINSRYGKDAKVSLMQKAEIASYYKGPVQDFNKEIQYNIQSGDPESIKNAVGAYEFARTRSPMSVMDITKDPKTVAFITSLSEKMKYSSDKTENLITATRESIYNVDNKTLKKRENDFREESSFRPDNIGKTIANMYGGDGWFSAPNEVSDRMKNAVGYMLHEAYKTEGSAAGAISIVQKQTENLIGTSEVNKIEKFGINPSTTMFLPPENQYGGKYSADEIRTRLNEDVKELAIAHNTTPDNIYLGSDEKSIAMAKKGLDPDYYVYYKDDQGHDIPIVDPNTHLLKRWSLNSSDKASIENEQLASKAETLLAKSTGMQKTADMIRRKEQLPKLGANLMDNMSTSMQTTDNLNAKGNTVLSSPEFNAKVVTANSTQEIASVYTKDPIQSDIILQTLERSIGADKSPGRIIESVSNISTILGGGVDNITLLKQGRVTTTPMTGDIAVSSQAQGLFAGLTTKNGVSHAKILQMNNGKMEIKEVPNVTVSYRTMPQQLTGANIRDRIKYMYSDQTVLGQIHQFKQQKVMRDEINKIAKGQKMKEDNAKQKFDPYTNSVIQYDKAGNRVGANQDNTKQSFDPYTNSVVQYDKDGNKTAGQSQNQTSSSNITGPNKYSTGGTNVQGANKRSSSTWWDSVVNKLANESKPDETLLPEMANGKLMNPVMNPVTGKYTNSPEEVNQILGRIKDNLSGHTGTIPAKNLNIISDFIKSTYSKKPREFSEAEWAVIIDFINEKGMPHGPI